MESFVQVNTKETKNVPFTMGKLADLKNIGGTGRSIIDHFA